jgi:hypothetical protein
VDEGQADHGHGRGTHKPASSCKHEGAWSRKLSSGGGTWTWPDGGTYVGKWEADQPYGQGTRTWAGGATLVGEWKAAGVTGTAPTFLRAATSMRGLAVDGQPYGRSTGTWLDRAKSVGDGTAHLRYGLGLRTYASSGKHEGDWHEGQPNGRGTYTWGDGGSYVGSWEAVMWARGNRLCGLMGVRPASQVLSCAGTGTSMRADGIKHSLRGAAPIQGGVARTMCERKAMS